MEPININQTHYVSQQTAWHGRIMLATWGVLSPIAIIITRFFKITPNQDWPKKLDSQVWWKTHWMSHTIAIVLTVIGLYLVAGNVTLDEISVHQAVGYMLVALAIAQVASGLLRGTKGGPTSPDKHGSIRGDHYDMTRRRKIFEAYHKTAGYAVVSLTAVAVPTGLIAANAPKWMLITIAAWWAGLATMFIMLQKKGMAVDTYQAIWGHHNKQKNEGEN